MDFDPGLHTFVVAGLRTLFVDDSADERDLFEVRFRLHGLVVTTAHTAALALALVERERFDLVVCDLRLPVCDGFELIRRIRRLTGERGTVPALAVSGLARPEDARRAVDAGFDALLAKPYDEEDFLALVRSLAPRLRRGEGASPRSSGGDTHDVGPGDAPDSRGGFRCSATATFFLGRARERAFA